MTEKLNQNRQPELSEHDAELLSAYIDEMLTADEQDALEARLENDLFLHGELTAMRQTVAWMNALPQLKAPRDFTISAEDVAEKPTAKIIPMQNRNLWMMASAAAVIILLFGVVAILPQFSGGNLAGSDSAQEAAEVAFQFTATAVPTMAQTQAPVFSTNNTEQTTSSGTTGIDTPADEAQDTTAGQAPQLQVESEAYDDADGDMADDGFAMADSEGESDDTTTAARSVDEWDSAQNIGGSGAGLDTSNQQTENNDDILPSPSIAMAGDTAESDGVPPVAPDSNANAMSVTTSTVEAEVASMVVAEATESPEEETIEEESADFEDAEGDTARETSVSDDDAELEQPAEALSLIQAFRQAMRHLVQELTP